MDIPLWVLIIAAAFIVGMAAGIHPPPPWPLGKEEEREAGPARKDASRATTLHEGEREDV